MLFFLFVVCIGTALFKVNKKYKWYDNLLITIYSMRSWFLVLAIFMYTLLSVTMITFLMEFHKDVMMKPLPYFGTIIGGIGFSNMAFVIGLCVYVIISIFTNDNIEKIEAKYNVPR